MSPDVALAARNAAVEQFYQSPRVRRVLFLRLRRFGALIPYEQFVQEGQSAIAAGVFRAWMNRFLSEQHPRFTLPRKRDIDQDYDRVLRNFPNFASFVPATPLTDEEVLTAAQQELNHSILLHEKRWHVSRNVRVDAQQLAAPGIEPILSPDILEAADRVLVGHGISNAIWWTFTRIIYESEYRTALRAIAPSLDGDAFRRAELNLRRQTKRLDLVAVGAR